MKSCNYIGEIKMNVSIFEVTGPIMTGPSSSHTAGAVKLALTARKIAGDEPVKVTFGMHGSFAKTYKGHGTDKALLAGVMGLLPDDDRISKAYEMAEEKGLLFEFYPIELSGCHENSVLMTLEGESGTVLKILGSSVGGGQILIGSIDGFETNLAATSPTILIAQQDKKGVVSAVTGILAQNNINIGIMRLSRKGRGDKAFTIIETDSPIEVSVEKQLSDLENVFFVRVLNF